MKGGERLERGLTPEPLAAPAAGSLLLHAALAGSIVAYGLVAGLFHHNVWGNAGSGGAIQVTLVTRAALPLPSDQPPNDNVLATEKPSQAPAEATPKTKQAVDESAIPISGKQAKAERENARKMQLHQPQQQDNRAQYGEQAESSMPRAVQTQGFTIGQTTVSDSDFGSRFGWYVDNLGRKMASNYYKPEVDPHTPRGARAYIQFAIHRDGSASGVQLSQSSGSSTLDRACIRAAQRVDTFGPLPAQYNQNILMTSYYCEY
ncbi:MAG: TonB family protein [Terracidiphilus sp.]